MNGIAGFLALAIATMTYFGASQAEAHEYGATFDELRQVNIDLATNHCWMSFQNGRMGMTAGTVSALLLQTDIKTFDSSIVPSVGKRLYARAGREAYNALIVGIEKQKVLLVIDATIVGDIMLEPMLPIAFYPTLGRTPAQTPRVWTNNFTRSQWASMLDCWDEIQHAE